jgi:hypothetical protein
MTRSTTYTERDLELALRHTRTFERFISEHRRMLLELTWEPGLKASAEALLTQLEQTLEQSRRRCEAISLALSGGGTQGAGG